MHPPTEVAGPGGRSHGVIHSLPSGIGGYSWADDDPSYVFPPSAPRDPAQEHARMARTLCALRHLADQFGGLSFGDVLRVANEQYGLLGTGYSRPATDSMVRMAAEAIDTCERSIIGPGFRPPDTLSYLHGYASRNGLGFETAVTHLTTRLITDLRHYADYQGIDFREALASGRRVHARQRLRAEGPFETGQGPGRLLPAPECRWSPDR